MKTLKTTLLLLALSLPLRAANNLDEHRHKKHDQVAVPEGGQPIAYLLVSGAAIAGVWVVRKRRVFRSVQ
jgi:hypothetical protein